MDKHKDNINTWMRSFRCSQGRWELFKANCEEIGISMGSVLRDSIDDFNERCADGDTK